MLPWSSAGAGDHGRVDPGDRPRERLFGSMPLGAIRADERRAGAQRGGLAEIDAVEPGQQVDHLAPDAARLDADAGVVAVDGRRVLQVLVASRTILTVPPA